MTRRGETPPSCGTELQPIGTEPSQTQQAALDYLEQVVKGRNELLLSKLKELFRSALTFVLAARTWRALNQLWPDPPAGCFCEVVHSYAHRLSV